MIKHIWSVLCGDASIDRDTNRISLLNILESLTVFGDVEQFKGVALNFEVVSDWEKEDDNPYEGMMRIKRRMPAGELSEVIKTKIDLTKSHFHRTRIRFNGMPLAGPGRYVFEIDYKEGEGKWKKAAELPIVINFEAQKNKQENP